MNVRIFWVRAMKCMCAQTRPRFILSSKGVFGGMEFEPMLTPREKSPLPENVPRGGSNPRHRGQRAQALPTELFRPPFLSKYSENHKENFQVLPYFIHCCWLLCFSLFPFLYEYKETTSRIFLFCHITVKYLVSAHPPPLSTNFLEK